MDVAKQITLFEIVDDYKQKKITDDRAYKKETIKLSNDAIQRLSQYTLENYVEDIKEIGLEATWDDICQFVLEKKDKVPELLDISNFAELYEIGLATQNKNLKKKSGQYYTPDDVAKVMSEWLSECEGTAVCDVACGTGQLILAYLDLIGEKKAKELIASGNLYLYDFDPIALKVCRMTIAYKYGLEIADAINDIYCDFLDKDIKLPDNCKVIANPPYSGIQVIQDYWEHTDVLLDTKEYYSAFMEKIFNQAVSTVIITPFSFISGSKFYSLRREMCRKANGFVVSFDNVPGNIFCGRKHGVFNSNTANSVRAAITVIQKSETKHGFRISPLIRFKNEERERLLLRSVLEETLPNQHQIITKERKSFEKIDKGLTNVFDMWVSKSDYTVKDFVTKENSNYLIDMPNTCRYFTTASGRKLNRSGSITVNVLDKEKYEFLYCFINSSFAYWWWRIYDGGITYPIGLFNNMPLPYNLLSDEDKIFFSKMTERLRNEENDYIIIKMNAGVPQENIKFPEKYRNEINKRILHILGFDMGGEIFTSVHANQFFSN